MEDNKTIIDNTATLLIENGFERLPEQASRLRFEREYADGTGRKFAVELAENEAGLFVAFHFDKKPLFSWTKVKSTNEVKELLLDKGLRLKQPQN